MSIESIHAYRFGFLKSEKWQAVRLEALVREKGHCQICNEESISNDAHHLWYPGNVYETTVDHLVVLCRPCHEFLHAMLPECKTRDEQFGKEQWKKFVTAIVAWKVSKMTFLDDPNVNLIGAGPKALRLQLAKINKELKDKSQIIAKYEKKFGPLDGESSQSGSSVSAAEEVRIVMAHVSRWAALYKHNAEKVHTPLDTPPEVT